jgi:hypothetical protein
MKQHIKYFLIFIFMSNTHLFAQTIFSNGTGGGVWSSSDTWLGGVVPNISSDVVISGGDSVNTTVGAACKTLSVYSGGILATSIDTVYVAETLTLEADAYFYNQTTHPTLPGNDYILDPQSYVVHSGSGTVGGIGNLEFGNLVIQRTAGCVPGGNLIVHGNLIINNSASNVVFRGVRPASGSLTHTVEGNVYIYRGIFSCIDVGANDLIGIWNILGNVYVLDEVEPYQESRIGPFSSANAAGLGIINIGGDLIVKGGRVQAGTSSSSGPGNGIINLEGNFSLDKNSSVATNTLGWFAFNFVGKGTQYVNLDNKFQMNTAIYDTVSAFSNVVFDLDTNKWGTSTSSSTAGEFVVNGSLEMVDSSFIDGPGSFKLNPEATLKIGSPFGINDSGSTGNIRVSGGRIFSEEANYEYNSTTSQQFGNGLPSIVNGLTINNPSGILLDRNLAVNGFLKTSNGDLDLNGNSIILDSDAILTETPGNTVIGLVGKLAITKDIGTPSELNVGGLGAVITSANNLGNTTVERSHAPGTGQGNQGIKRVFNITPTNNLGLNAKLRFYYDESELNSIPENELIFFKSLDGTNNSWFSMGGTVNTTENYVEVSGLNDFSFWTIAGTNSPLPVEAEQNAIPDQFELMQNYPNPFNPSTTIHYSIAKREYVTIKVFDIIGNEVAALVDEFKPAGHYEVDFSTVETRHGVSLPSGVYFYQLRTESFVQTRKMILIK